MMLVLLLKKRSWIWMLLFTLYTPFIQANPMGFEALPKPIQVKLEHSIEQVFTGKKDSLRFVLLAGGLSGTPVYKILDNENEYVARVLDDNLLLNRKTILFSRLAGENDYGPRVHYPIDEQYDVGVMITGFAKGQPLKFEDFDEYKVALAAAVRRMHDTPFESLPPSDDMFKRIRYHFAKVGSVGPFLDDIIYLEKIDNTLRANVTHYTLTHQDLTAGNVLYDGKQFSFIDWPNGGFGDPIADVANLTFDLALTQEQALDFLKLYLETSSPSKKQVAHFLLLRQVAFFRLAAFSYENIYKLGGIYTSLKPKHTLRELMYMASKGEFVPNGPAEFHQVLESSMVEWRKEKEMAENWLNDLKK